jgi:amino acid efflux transporter
MASGSRLGYALARDGAFPRPLARLNRTGVPTRSVGVVFLYALVGLGLLYLNGGGAEDLVFVSSTLGIATYIIAMAAALRLLKTAAARGMAIVSLCVCAAIFGLGGGSVLLASLVAALAIGYRVLGMRRAERQLTN